MAARNYQPTLIRLMHILNKFISRYQSLIAAGLDTTQATYFAALITALDNMINSLPPEHGV